jgi:hypothetical protein
VDGLNDPSPEDKQVWGAALNLGESVTINKRPQIPHKKASLPRFNTECILFTKHGRKNKKTKKTLRKLILRFWK